MYIIFNGVIFNIIASTRVIVLDLPAALEELARSLRSKLDS